MLMLLQLCCFCYQFQTVTLLMLLAVSAATAGSLSAAAGQLLLVLACVPHCCALSYSPTRFYESDYVPNLGIHQYYRFDDDNNCKSTPEKNKQKEREMKRDEMIVRFNTIVDSITIIFSNQPDQHHNYEIRGDAAPQTFHCIFLKKKQLHIRLHFCSSTEATIFQQRKQ